MDQLLDWLPDSPLVSFTILLLVVLTLPPLFERLRLPGLVGLLVAGICLGPQGLGLLEAESETMKLLSDVGKIYLMFVAGLEIDLENFRKKKERSLLFGILTFLCPLIVGTLVGRSFQMGWNASVLLGSLMASHTLLGYPIVIRLGMSKQEAVTVSIGATIFTDIAALLVLAICVSIHAGEFSAASLVMQLGSLGLYCGIILFGFDWAGKEYFRRTGDDQGNQFLFILIAVFLASLGAQLINVDPIVGAFLAGLAINDVVGRSPVEEKVVFVGSILFIPFFFVDMGLLLDIQELISTLATELVLTLGIVGGLLGSKFLAALAVKFPFGYSWAETMTMWSLSMPQVAATLAAALVGVNVGLISSLLLNVVIVMMLVTSILGPILTARFARRLPFPTPPVVRAAESWDLGEHQGLTDQHHQDLHHPFTVVVPIYNPHTQRYLIEAGALLARQESGILVPLTITKAHVHMDEPELTVALEHSQRLLDRAVAVSQEFQVNSRPATRIDDDVAHGISRTAREVEAHLILLGWRPPTGLRARLFGTVIDKVFWSAHCPVAVLRLMDEPINIHRILVPVKTLSPEALRPIRFAQLFAEANQARVTVLHFYDPQTSQQSVESFQQDLIQVLSQHHSTIHPEVICLSQEDVATGIIESARSFDMVVLRSIRRRTAGGLAVSNITTQVLSRVSCSIVLFGEPHLSGQANLLPGLSLEMISEVST